MELTPEEGRVLGALVEKELTTPQAYPLTDNALVAACNQTTSREPVVSYDVPTVRVAVRSLREQGLLRTVHRTGERSDKHQHELSAALGLSDEEVAALAVLLLRGPQTAAEVRARSERLHAFRTVEDVEDVLMSLADRELTVLLERQPGRKEPRWAQRLAEGGLPGAGVPVVGVPTGTPHVPVTAPTPAAPPPAAGPMSGTAPAEIAELRAEVAGLRAEVAGLRAQVEQLLD